MIPPEQPARQPVESIQSYREAVMSVLTINLELPNRKLQVKIDLDEQYSNEKTISSYLHSGRYYEPDVSTTLIRLVREGDSIVDVGANAGFFSVLLGALTGKSGQVLSIEPGAHNLSRLKNNLSLNGFSHVTVSDRPVTDKEGEVSFFINSDDSGGNALWDPRQFPGNRKTSENPIAHTLSATTLERAVADAGLRVPRLIKIDTEGAEQRILEGAGSLIRDRKVPYVVAELHEFGLNQMGCSQASLRAVMEGHGYSTFLLYPDGSLPKLIPPGTLIQSDYFLNLLFSTPRDVAAGWPVEHHVPRL